MLMSSDDSLVLQQITTLFSTFSISLLGISIFSYFSHVASNSSIYSDIFRPFLGYFRSFELTFQTQNRFHQDVCWDGTTDVLSAHRRWRRMKRRRRARATPVRHSPERRWSSRNPPYPEPAGKRAGLGEKPRRLPPPNFPGSPLNPQQQPPCWSLLWRRPAVKRKGCRKI